MTIGRATAFASVLIRSAPARRRRSSRRWGCRRPRAGRERHRRVRRSHGLDRRIQPVETLIRHACRRYRAPSRRPACPRRRRPADACACTDSRIVSSSSGPATARPPLRRSMPSAASRSAASRQTCVIRPMPHSVTSLPVRTTSAFPIGSVYGLLRHVAFRRESQELVLHHHDRAVVADGGDGQALRVVRGARAPRPSSRGRAPASRRASASAAPPRRRRRSACRRGCRRPCG